MYLCLQDSQKIQIQFQTPGPLSWFVESPSPFWHETVDLFHSLFPWQLFLRAQQGFSRRQSAAVKSLFTAGLKLFIGMLLQHHRLSSMSISTPQIIMYIIAVSMAMLLIWLLTDHFDTEQLSIIKNKEIIHLLLCFLWKHRILMWALKSNISDKVLKLKPEFVECASKLISRVILPDNRCFVVHLPNNETLQAARPPSTGW